MKIVQFGETIFEGTDAEFEEWSKSFYQNEKGLWCIDVDINSLKGTFGDFACIEEVDTGKIIYMNPEIESKATEAILNAKFIS